MNEQHYIYNNKKITPDEFLNILNYYYNLDNEKKVNIKYSINIGYDNNNNKLAILNFYYINKKEKIFLSNTEINFIVHKYAYDNNYKLDYFQFITGVRLIENNSQLKKDTPIFDGVYIYYSELVNKKMKK